MKAWLLFGSVSGVSFGGWLAQVAKGRAVPASHSAQAAIVPAVSTSRQEPGEKKVLAYLGL